MDASQLWSWEIHAQALSLGTVAVAIIAAGITGYFAWWQSKTARDTLRLNMYEEFVHQLGAMATKAMLTRARLKRNSDHPKADELIDEEEDILEFLSEQGSRLEDVFAPYLDMARIGLR